MGALAADIAVVFDPSRNIGLRQKQSDSADTYFRGGLAHTTAGQLTLTPTAAETFAGILMEHRVTTAAAEMVWVATGGRFHFTCTNFTLANEEKGFALQVGDFFDDPSTMNITAGGDGATVGILDHVTVTAADGWLDISRRNTPENTA